MASYMLCKENEINVGEMKCFSVADTKVVVYHLEDGFYATQAKCTHLFAPLHKGTGIQRLLLEHGAQSGAAARRG